MSAGEPIDVDDLPEWHAYPHVEITPTKLMQTVPAHKPGEGAIGDCYRTCIAMILGAKDPTWVPHFTEQTMHIEHRPGWYSLALARWWVRSELGFDLLFVSQEEAATMDVPYVLPVQSKTGPWKHCIVAVGNDVWHDPSGVGGYTIEDATGDSCDIVTSHLYRPDPAEMVRQWALAAVDEVFATLNPAPSTELPEAPADPEQGG